MTDPIERMARAIWGETGGQAFLWREMTDSMKHDFRLKARAALSALSAGEHEDLAGRLERCVDRGSECYGDITDDLLEASSLLRALTARAEKAEAERDALRRDFAVLQKALVGNTGASAIQTAERLREEFECTCGAGHGSLEGHTDWCEWEPRREGDPQ